jgi:DNA-directed RNA polymerase subunit alpha
LLDLGLEEAKIECTASSENYARYVMEPLPSGFGTTLGNALRRVLLSSLEGTAITWVRVEQVQHEFSTIPGAKEDTTEFLLNVKRIRLRSFSDRAGRLQLEAEGRGEVTAGDINVSADFEIVNPELHLLTLDSPDARLIVELNVERGTGYRPNTEQDGLPIGVIPVDAIFTPVRKVNYLVESTRRGSQTNLDRLILEIWTDGTVTPGDALSSAADILIGRLQQLRDFGRMALPQPGPHPVTPSTIPSRIYDLPIEDLDLSVRAYNCLKRSGLTKVGQVLEMNEQDLLAVRNFGRKSLDELVERLQSRDLLVGPLADSLQNPQDETGRFITSSLGGEGEGFDDEDYYAESDEDLEDYDLDEETEER